MKITEYTWVHTSIFALVTACVAVACDESPAVEEEDLAVEALDEEQPEAREGSLADLDVEDAEDAEAEEAEAEDEDEDATVDKERRWDDDDDDDGWGRRHGGWGRRHGGWGRRHGGWGRRHW
ncbi:hypothetical protein [Nannocystis radixulma]|uniref:Uncharacterized protein n=1 Tax=Nannocystis radixulma TaxID=2995305 RepID=A0ABT5B368_9BACT|nr:hypothetical protein [Nannocystis radixulma]MDC0668535.1 hypothetical protein [Nannocystis radixulma]